MVNNLCVLIFQQRTLEDLILTGRRVPIICAVGQIDVLGMFQALKVECH